MRKTKKIYASVLILVGISYLTLSFSPCLSATVLHERNLGGKIPWAAVFTTLFGGLAFFLYGMEKMSQGMKKAAGDKVKSILGMFTRNRVAGLVAGAFVTMLLQSSSATTVMLVGFVNAGLMDFSQTLGVILGADIGTTITAQIIAFKVSNYALVMVGTGFFMAAFGRDEKIRNSGDVIMGIGLLFFGMHLMSSAMEPLRSCDNFKNLLNGLENPVAGILTGTLLTALIQSSAAFIGIVIALAHQGSITLEAGIPLILGANIGTCITAVLASIGTSRDGKRVAVAHVLFKVVGVLLFCFWIPRFAGLIRYISAQFTSNTARYIVNAHTVFNVSVALVFLPFTHLFSRLIMAILPRRRWEVAERLVTFYLDENSIVYPSVAMNLARAEMARMTMLVWKMLSTIIAPFILGKRYDEDRYRHLMETVHTQEKKLDFLEKKIVSYLLKITRRELSERQVLEIYGMMSIVKDLEGIGDIIHRSIMPLIEKKRRLDTDFSPEGKEELSLYHERACDTLLQLKRALMESDPEKAASIMERGKDVLRLEGKYRLQHLERLRYNNRESIETHEIHMELMDLMKHIVIYLTNIARTYMNTFTPRAEEGSVP